MSRILYFHLNHCFLPTLSEWFHNHPNNHNGSPFCIPSTPLLRHRRLWGSFDHSFDTRNCLHMDRAHSGAQSQGHSLVRSAPLDIHSGKPTMLQYLFSFKVLGCFRLLQAPSPQATALQNLWRLHLFLLNSNWT